MTPELAIRLIQSKFAEHEGVVTVPLMNQNQFFTAELADGGIAVSNLGRQPFLPWSVFRAVVRLLNEKGGTAIKGNAMNSRLGEEGLPLESVEGHIATTVYHKSPGVFVFKRISPVAAILHLAGICINEAGYLSLCVSDVNEAFEELERKAPLSGEIQEFDRGKEVSFMDVVALFVREQLSKVNMDQEYWKEKSWLETIEFRRNHSLELNSKEKELREVLQWGGIYGFKQWHLYQPALELLQEEQELPEDIHSRISSFSKLFSFYQPDKYFILDARVAFTLNNLIKSYHPEQQGFDFPFMMKSRNKGINQAAPLLTLNHYFRDLGVAYYAYNRLVLDVYNVLKKQHVAIEYPELVEMVLFKYADLFFLTLPNQANS